MAHMTFTDDGLWIHEVSDPAGQAIKMMIMQFRAQRNISDETWQVRVYGLPGGEQIDVWIGKPPATSCREHRTIIDSPEAGTKMLSWLMELEDSN